MYDKKELNRIKEKKIDWEKNRYSKLVRVHPERKDKFENLSGTEIKNIYTPEDIEHLEYSKDIVSIFTGCSFNYAPRSFVDNASVCWVWQCRRDK
jgi:hypothetical protein